MFATFEAKNSDFRTSSFANSGYVHCCRLVLDIELALILLTPCQDRPIVERWRMFAENLTNVYQMYANIGTRKVHHFNPYTNSVTLTITKYVLIIYLWSIEFHKIVFSCHSPSISSIFLNIADFWAKSCRRSRQDQVLYLVWFFLVEVVYQIERRYWL